MKKLILSFWLVILAITSFSQEPQWKVFANGEVINSLSQDTNNILAATAGGGLVIINKATMNATFIKKEQLTIPSNQVNFVEGSLINGKIRLSTNQGLAVFDPDSNRWLLFSHDSIPEIPLDRVTATAGTNTDLFVACDSYFDEFLNSWVYGGMARYNNVHGWSAFGTYELSSIRQRCVSLSPNNDKVFIGGMFGNAPPSGGIDVYDLTDSSWIHAFTGNSGLPDDDINCIYFDTYNNNVLVGTESGLAQHTGLNNIAETANWLVMDTSNSNLPDNHITCLATRFVSGPDHHYWYVGTRFGGLLKLDKTDGTWAVYDSSNTNLGSNNITSLCIEYDNPDVLWVGTDNGLFRYDQTTFTKVITSEFNIASNFINDVDISSNNTKWIATTRGLTEFQTGFTNYDPYNSGLKYYGVNTVFAKSNEVWIGGNNVTEGPLCLHNGSDWTYFLDATAGYPFLHTVLDITTDPAGDLWLASDYGVFKYVAPYFVNWNATGGAQTLPSNHVKAIMADQANHIWIATNNGAAKNTNTPWDVYNPVNSGIPSYTVNAVIQDDSSYYWFATDKGLAKFDLAANIWTVYDTMISNFPSMNIYDVDHEGDSMIWVASRNGIACFDRATQLWTTYNAASSLLPEDVINKIKVDSYGNKWICTKIGGLVEFNRNTIASSIRPTGEENNTLSVFPVPAAHRISIVSNSKSKLSDVRIYSITGQLLMQPEVSQQKSQRVEVDIDLLSNGIYFVVITDQYSTRSQKFVVSR